MDRNVSWHCVYQTLQLLVKSSLVHEIISDDGTGRRYTHDIAIAQCSHARLVCKDCGMMVAGGRVISLRPGSHWISSKEQNNPSRRFVMSIFEKHTQRHRARNWQFF